MEKTVVEEFTSRQGEDASSLPNPHQNEESVNNSITSDKAQDEAELLHVQSEGPRSDDSSTNGYHRDTSRHIGGGPHPGEDKSQTKLDEGVMESRALPAACVLNELPNPPLAPVPPQVQKIEMDPVFLGDVQDETTVDEMKIQTMYKMVEDVNVTVLGREVLKKVLYLTNKQANLFDEQAMARCIQALDIGEPKFVIILAPSCGVESQMRIAHTEWLKRSRFEYESVGYLTSEIDTKDDVIVQTQVLLFMRTCILPLAKQTRAIILVGGANDCYLSAALSNVVLAEQARLGKDCPFTVIATAHEFEIHSQAVSLKDRASLSAQLARGSKTWSRRMPVVHKYVSTAFTTYQRCDLTPAASRYIIFECFDENTGEGTAVINAGAKKMFQATLLQCLTRKLPSIAIQSHKIDSQISYLAELAARNIPVLLLDSSERAITQRKQLSPSGPATKLATESNSFPTISLERLNKIQVLDDRITAEGRQELLDIACEMMERKGMCFVKHGVFDALDASLVSFFHSALRLGGTHTDGSTGAGANVPLYARIRELERLRRSNKDSTQAQVPSELASKAITFIHTRVEALAISARLAKVEKWLEFHDPDVEHLVPQALKLREKLKVKCDAIELAGGLVQTPPVPSRWLELFDVLISSNTFSGSIHDLDELKRILGSVAKIDRLPSANSLEALRTLQEAWDHVEVYHQVAKSYKLVSKATYVLLLLVGIAITALSLTECVVGFSSRISVIALSFVGTAVAAYVSYTNPGQRWQQLRTAASAIESNIWLFRTRAGPYRTAGEGLDHHADRLLAESLREIKARVLEGADIKTTAFFSRVSSQNLHGQHPSGQAGFGTLDSAKPQPVGRASVLNALPFGSVGVGGKGMRIHDAGHIAPERDDQDSPSHPAGEDNPAFKVFTRMMTERQRKGNHEVRLDEVVAWLCQNEAESENQAVDSHYTPVQPDSYIRFRVAKALAFYQRRIPICNHTRNVAQAFLILGSLTAGGLAFADLSSWAGAVSIVTSGITAYLEFQGTTGKISRYSFTVHALQELIFWWQTLPQIDRSVVGNIDRLVASCEEILQREQQAWRSSSQAMRLLQDRSKETAANQA